MGNTAKVWKGNSKRKIVGMIPAMDQTQAKWANRQMIPGWTSPSYVFVLFGFLIQLVLEIIFLRIELHREKEQSAWYLEQLRRYAREKYVGKSAQSEYSGEQIVMEEVIAWLRDHAEAGDGLTDPGQTYTTVKPHERKKRKPRGQSLVNILTGIFPEKVVHHYPEDLTCPECQEKLQHIGVCEERRSLVIVPATVEVRVDVVHSFACSNCEKHSTSAHVVTGDMPKAVLPGSFATAEAIAYIATEKFQLGVPVYRQEKYFMIKGIALSRTTMNKWLLDAAEILEPYMEWVHIYMLQEEVLLGDETTIRYPDSELHKHMRTGYIWLVCTSRHSDHQLVQFRFHEDRKYVNHTEYIIGFEGFFQSDGFDAYHGHEGIISVGCLSHANRKFVDAVKDGRSVSYKALAQIAINSFDRIFKYESDIHDLPPEELLKKRIELCKPEMERLELWLKKQKEQMLPKSLLSRAVTYSLNQWEYMTNIFLDGRLDATNNRCERLIKDYVLSRKAFLFVMGERGGKATGIYTSLIAIAKLNHLDPYKYIVWLLEAGAQGHFHDPNQMERYMPWNAPASIKVPTSPDRSASLP